MKKIKLSATRINTFLQCKRRYFYSYVERAQRLASPAFRLGRAVHEALEFAGNIWVDNELVAFDSAQVDTIIAKYQEVAISEGVFDSVDYMEGIDLLKKRLQDFEAHGKILDLEIQFGFKGTKTIKTKNGVELIGAIDKVVEVDEDTLMIVDYKTSRTVPDVDKLRTDVQLSMYNYVANSLYPGYKRVILSLDMLRSSELVYTYRTEEELALFEKFLEETHKQMSEFDAENVKGELNFLCSWCDFRNMCEECKDALDYTGAKVLPPEELSEEELLLEWERIRSVLKLAEMRKGELATFVMTSLDNNVNDLTDGKTRFVVEQRKRTTYKPEALIDLVPKEDFVNMINASPTKVKAYANNNPKVKKAILDSGQTAFNSPFVGTRKARADKKK